MAKPHHHQPRVVIAGGGFAGVRAARKLSRHPGLDVTLLSATDSFAYYPQLYHAATGGSRSESSLPYADLFAHLPVRLVKDTVTGFDPVHKAVTSQTASYPYDHLILALGSVTNYFGIQGLPEFSYDIKTISGAERFKAHLHKELIEDKKPDLNYVVVGAGPTGVELAAALGDYLRYITHKHGMSKPKYRIDLVEAAPRILPHSPQTVSDKVAQQLRQLGVTVMTGQTVKAETAGALKLGGETLKTKTVVWTAGVANNPFFTANAKYFKIAKNHKVVVSEHLQTHPQVYVLGDNADTEFSGMAQTAIADADFAAEDIMRILARRPRPVYRTKRPASVIPVGEYWASADWGLLRLYGLAGWGLRRAADLIGYADVESWPGALRVWLQDTRREDNCPICGSAVPSAKARSSA
jgi:NADH dehydrogenase